MTIRSWMHNLFAPRPSRAGRKSPARRPFVELLEDRVVPAALVEPGSEPTYVQNLYSEVLDRTGSDSEVADWVNHLHAGQSPDQVADGFLGSSEYYTRRVGELYLEVLDRPADDAGLQGFVTQLLNGSTERSVLAQMLKSAEYNTLHADNTDFVNSLFQDSLGRAPTAQELSTYLGHLATSGRAGVVDGVLGSLERSQVEVKGLFSSYLGRPADAQSLASMAGSLHQGAATFRQLSVTIVSSAENQLQALHPAANAPVITNVVSTGETTVWVTFSEPMATNAANQARYRITQRNQNLQVSSASFVGTSRSVVQLTTATQNDGAYSLSIQGTVTDLGNNRVAENVAHQFAGTPPALDTDGEGLSDFYENKGWQVSVTAANGSVTTRTVTSDRTRPDTDFDGLNDAQEKGLGTDPRAADTDADGLSDFAELVARSVTYVTAGGQTVTTQVTSSPLKVDTDADGLRDADEKAQNTDPGRADTDTDDLSDGEELAPREVTITKLNGAAVTRDVTSDPLKGDTDGDGLDDRREKTLSTDPRAADTDDDQLSDSLEVIQIRSDPTRQDSDGDGVDDGTEFASGAGAGTVTNPPPLTDTTPPRVTGAASLSNTTVLVSFSEAMSGGILEGDPADPLDDVIFGVLNPSHYFIVQQNVNSEVGFVPVLSAAFNGDNRSVLLTTASQNEVTYSVTALNVTDLAGNALAPASFTASGQRIDPSTAVFPGTPASGPQIVDADGDGLSNAQEVRGYVITITQVNGTTFTRQVTSDSALEDTDGDGLSDPQELNIGTDPRVADTDGDQLDDNAEFNEIYSDPTKQDSDGDGLDDFLEFDFFYTSPFFADSDGDQIDDGDEILGNRNPRVSDLPRPEIEVGEVSLRLDVRVSESNARETRELETKSVTTTLAQSESKSLSRQFTANVEAHIEASAGTLFDDGKPERFSGLKVGGSAGFTFQQTEESASETQRAYEDSQSTEEEVTSGFTTERQVVGAVMQVTVNLRNVSDLAYRVKNLQVTAFIQDPQDHSKLTPVATLLPDSEPEEGFTLGPLVTNRGPLIFSNTTIVPTLVESLMANSTGLIFRISNYDIINEDGRNFAFVSQDVVERTAGLVLDFGGARSLRAQVSGVPIDENQPGDETEIHRIATSAGRVIEDTDGDGTLDPNEGHKLVRVDFQNGETFAYEDGGEATDGPGEEIRPSTGDVTLVGNQWRAFEFPTTITTDSVLEFDLLVNVPFDQPFTASPEVTAIGLDDDLTASPDRIFQISGTQTDYGLQDFHTYGPASNFTWQHYVIPIGQFPQFLGENKYLTVVSDNDANPSTVVGQGYRISFRNVKVSGQYQGDKRVIFDATGKEVGITLFEGLAAIGLTRFEARLDPATGRYLEYEPGATNPFDFANKDDLFLNSYSTFLDDAGREKIFRIRGVANDLVIQKYWEILTPLGIDQETDLSRLILKTDMPASLNYVQDLDDDRLPADVEYFLRTTDSPLPFGANVPGSTDTAAETVRFNTDPGLATGTLVRVSADGAGLLAGTNYFARNLGGGSYSFYNTAANATTGGTTGRINLTAEVRAGVFSPVSPTATNLAAESVTFDPGFATATRVRVIATGGGLTAGTDYFVRNLGGSSYGFYDTAAHASALASTEGRINLTGNVGAGIFDLTNPTRVFYPASTDFVSQSVSFDPAFATGTVVTVTASNADLTAGANYFLRNLGGGVYSFYGSVADAIAGTATGRVNLTVNVTAGVFSPTAKGRDTDRDGLDDRFEALIGWSVSTPIRTFTAYSSPSRRDSNFDNPRLGVDSDEDGVPDRNEYNGSDLEAAPAGWNDRLTADTDGDGVPDAPNGLRDRFETFQVDVDDLVLDPIRKDTDADGINDATEVIGFRITRIDDGSRPLIDHTNPNTPFTDSDTFTDGFERLVGLDPTDGRDTDEDGDGLPDQVEVVSGWKVGKLVPEIQRVIVFGPFPFPIPTTFTLQVGPDTTPSLPFEASDDDVERALNNLPSIRDVGGLVTVTTETRIPFVLNQFRVTIGGTLAGKDQPLLIVQSSFIFPPVVTTVQDGQIALEGVSPAPFAPGPQTQRLGKSRTDSVDSDGDGLTDYEEFFLRTDAMAKDTDGDGIDDRVESLGYRLGHNVGTEDVGIIATDPLDADSDDDMRSDGDEAELVDVELERWVVRVTGAVAEDQVSSASAYRVFSNPLVADADFDGLVDGEEKAIGTDPNKGNTDGDKRDDREERDGGTNPLVDDFRVTVFFNSLTITADGGWPNGENGDFAFDFGVRKPGTGVAGLDTVFSSVVHDTIRLTDPFRFELALNEQQVEPLLPAGQGSLQNNNRSPGIAFEGNVGGGTTLTLAQYLPVGQRSITFGMTANQTFSVEGIVAELDLKGGRPQFSTNPADYNVFYDYLGGVDGIKANMPGNWRGDDNTPTAEANASRTIRPVFRGSDLAVAPSPFQDFEIHFVRADQLAGPNNNSPANDSIGGFLSFTVFVG